MQTHLAGAHRWSFPLPLRAAQFAVLVFLSIVIAPVTVLAQGSSPGPSMTLEQAQQLADERVADQLDAYDPMDDLGSLEPADGKWLKAEDGREYFLAPLKKVDGTFSWVDADHIRYQHWYVFKVDDQDDENFYVRVYRTIEMPEPITAEERAQEEEQERLRINALYQPEVAQGDRLVMKAFDAGLPKEGRWRNGFDIADVNGDGFLDIVHGPARKSGPRPVIFLGDGQGNWRVWQEARFPLAPYDYGDAAAGDFNGDGLMDLAFGFHLRGLLVVIQQQPGRFVPWSEGVDLVVPGRGGSDSGFSSRAIEVADWNGDGRLDLLASGEGPRPTIRISGGAGPTSRVESYGAVIYLNEGDGTWERLAKGVTHGNVFGDSLAVGDINGDGHADLVTASLLLGRRDILRLGQGDASWVTEAPEGLRPRSYLQSVELADFDGDGRDDLAVGFASWESKVWRSAVELLLSKEDGWHRKTLAFDEGRRSFWSLDAGDVDGDGHMDLAALDGAGDIWLFLGDGAGNFTQEKSPELEGLGNGCRGYHVMLRDLNADGRDEVVASWSGEGSTLPIPGLQNRCQSFGALRAWTPQLGHVEGHAGGAVSEAAGMGTAP